MVTPVTSQDLDLGAQGEQRINSIVTDLYRLFKGWSQRGFGPDDVTWCEVKAEIKKLLDINTTRSKVAQGEPVAWALYRDAVETAYAIVDRAMWEENWTTAHPGHKALKQLKDLALKAPAAPRTGSGVSAEEIARQVFIANNVAHGGTPQSAAGDWSAGIFPRDRDMAFKAAGAILALSANKQTKRRASTEAIADILRRELIVRRDYDSVMRAMDWIDGIDEAARAIIALIAQAPRDGGETQGGWQPIETAPKDGTRILLFGMERSFLEHRSFVGRWDEDRAGGSWTGPEWRCLPSHWRPLPTPPSGVETIRQDSEGATDA